MVLEAGLPVLWLERGVHTLVTFGSSGEAVGRGLARLADEVRAGRMAAVTIEKMNGTGVLQDKQAASLLAGAGFAMTPQGYRLRTGSSTTG